MAGAGRADAIPAPQTVPAAAPDERVYAVIGRETTTAGIGDRFSVQFQSSLLRNRETGTILQCNFMTVKGTPEEQQTPNTKPPTLYIQAVPGGIDLADSLRPAPGADQSNVGSCLPYESPLTSEQLDGKSPGTLPRASVMVGFGTPDNMAVAYGMGTYLDPVRERRLEGLYWSEKLKDKPASPLPLVMKWGNQPHYILRTGACENTGITATMGKIDATGLNAPVDNIPLRRNCPELR